jgi:hypothetical protein
VTEATEEEGTPQRMPPAPDQNACQAEASHKSVPGHAQSSLKARACLVIKAVSVLMALVGLGAGVRERERGRERERVLFFFLVCKKSCKSKKPCKSKSNWTGEHTYTHTQVWEIGCNSNFTIVPSCSTAQRVLLSSLRSLCLYEETECSM